MDWGAIVIGTLVGGLGMFMWYGVAWMVLPHHKKDFRGVSDAESMEKALSSMPPVDAFYSLPFAGDYEKGPGDPALLERMKQGPNAMLVVLPNAPPAGPGTFVRGLLINFGEVFACAVLLGLLGTTIDGLFQTVAFCVGLGVFTSLSYVTMSNWMFVPRRYALMSIVDGAVAFAVAGVLLHFLGP